MGVDERAEGAPGRPPRPVLLDADQVGQAAPVRPLAEPDGGAAPLDGFEQAPDEGDGVRTAGTVAVAPVDLPVIGSCIRVLLGATDRSRGLAYLAIALLVAAVAVLVGVFLAD